MSTLDWYLLFMLAVFGFMVALSAGMGALMVIFHVSAGICDSIDRWFKGKAK